MSDKVFIYGLVDPQTNQLRYVGKSVNPNNRLSRHIFDRNKRDTHKDRWLRKLINEEGVRPNLTIIDEVDKDNWQYWEKFYISYFRSVGSKLVNSTDGGDQPPCTKGRKHTLESKVKMSETKKGKPIPWLNTGKPRTEEHKKNLSKSLKGRKSPNEGKTFSDNYKKKLSEASTCKKSVLQLTLKNEIIKEWPSVNSVEKSLNIRHISECCRGINYKTVGGFRWYYKEDYGK